MSAELNLLRIKGSLLQALEQFILAKQGLELVIDGHDEECTSHGELWDWSMEQISLANPYVVYADADEDRDESEEDDISEEEDFVETEEAATEEKIKKLSGPKEVLSDNDYRCPDCDGDIADGDTAWEVMAGRKVLFACTEECANNLLSSSSSAH
jgi:hypothetical protein